MNTTSLKEPISYGVDTGKPGGDETALTIRHGNELFTFIGREAEVVIALLAQHTASVERESRIDEAGLWLNMVVRNDHSRLNSNEWYKLNPRAVSRFFAERLKKLNSKDNLNSKGGIDNDV